MITAEYEKAVADRIQLRLAPGGWYGYAAPLGWARLCDELDLAIAELCPDYKVNQIKSKFGGLRYYIETPGVDEETYHQIHELIAVAEAASYKICECCGDPAVDESTISNYGFVWTACEPCAVKLVQGRRPWNGDWENEGGTPSDDLKEP